jgi:hypothetical protein
MFIQILFQMQFLRPRKHCVPITKPVCGQYTRVQDYRVCGTYSNHCFTWINTYHTFFAGIYILKIISPCYYVKWVRGVGMAVNINIKGLYHLSLW